MSAAQHQFTVFYDGDDLAEFAMDAKSVARSIYSFVELFEEINKVIHEGADAPALSLQVIAHGKDSTESFQAGSFGWDFRVITDAANQTIDMFKGVGGELAKRAAKYGIPTALVAEIGELTKKINARDMEIHKLKDGKYLVRLDGEDVAVEAYQAQLLANDRVQKALHRIVAPLQKPGVDRFGITTDIHEKDSSILSVNSGDEARSFRGSKAALIPLVEEYEVTAACFIDTLSYNPSSRWKLVSDSVNDGRPFTVDINDAVFLNKVALHNEAFAKNDVLVVRLYVKRIFNPVSTKSVVSYTIIEVLEHNSAAKQSNFFNG